MLNAFSILFMLTLFKKQRIGIVTTFLDHDGA